MPYKIKKPQATVYRWPAVFRTVKALVAAGDGDGELAADSETESLVLGQKLQLVIDDDVLKHLAQRLLAASVVVGDAVDLITASVHTHKFTQSA